MAYTTINKPSEYFNTLLYTGTGSAQSLTGVGFQPDLVWFHCRSNTNDTSLFDVIRGGTKAIYSNLYIGERTKTLALTSFDSDGFSLGGASGETNDNGATYVAWNWLADNTSGSSNTDGSITSTVSVSTTSGFSIVKYTGTGSVATVGHGLNSTPEIVLIKNLSTDNSWRMYSVPVGTGGQLALDQTSPADSGNTAMWNNTAPTSSVFTVGTHPGVNESSSNLIAYCWHSVKGFSKFGSYTGNGNADGPFIYTGFKPAFVMIKNISATESWYILDTKRPSYNTNNYYILPNNSDPEGTSTTLATSLLSNGIKIENADTSMNTSGQTYIYMAFAEAPLVGTNGVPTTAR